MELPDIMEQASIWQNNHRHIMLYHIIYDDVTRCMNKTHTVKSNAYCNFYYSASLMVFFQI